VRPRRDVVKRGVGDLFRGTVVKVDVSARLREGRDDDGARPRGDVELNGGGGPGGDRHFAGAGNGSTVGGNHVDLVRAGGDRTDDLVRLDAGVEYEVEPDRGTGLGEGRDVHPAVLALRRAGGGEGQRAQEGAQ